MNNYLSLFSIIWRYINYYGGPTQTPTYSSFSRRTIDSSLRTTVNVCFGISGNHPGFLAEFEVALKSVLLNAPLQSDLSIHILADSDAYVAVGAILYQTGLNGTLWRNSITIQTYNVAPYLENWTNEIKQLNTDMDFGKHTIGAYFRLYMHRVLPNSIGHILYMDTDIVIMANLDNLWTNIDRDAVFQWGEDLCAGFVILNLPKLDTVLDMARRVDLAAIANSTGRSMDDQLIFVAINYTFPDVVAVLPEEWAISVAAGAWRHANDIVDYRPKVGMFHFNGGGSSKEEYWKGEFVTGLADTWGVGTFYYVKLPWTWAKFIGESMKGDGSGNPLIIHHNQ